MNNTPPGNNILVSGSKQPAKQFGDNFNEDTFPLTGILHGIGRLGDISSEKGKVSKPDGSGWDSASLFGFIDERGRDAAGKDTGFTTEMGSPDLLLCTDLNTEVADFICLKQDTVIFMHVKGKGNDVAASLYGASKITDVCGQAIKNVHYLSVFDNSVPKNVNTFNKPHIIQVDNRKNKIDIHVKTRIRTKLPNARITGNELWEMIKRVKFDGGSTKEVWLVLGKIFSKRAFLDELAKENPAPEAIQAAIILQNTLAGIGSMGVKLKIFCSP